MIDVLYSPTGGTITADEIRQQADLLPHTRTEPRPRLVQGDTMRQLIRWTQVGEGEWSSSFTVGPVACYWASNDGLGDFGWYYQQHSAAANVQFRSTSPIAITGEWTLVGTFAGVLSPLDRQPFSAGAQPLVANRSWVAPETILGRLDVRTSVDPANIPVTLVLQWALIVSQPIR